MKNISAILMTSGILVLLAGCGEEKTITNNPAPKVSVEQPVKATPQKSVTKPSKAMASNAAPGTACHSKVVGQTESLTVTACYERLGMPPEAFADICNQYGAFDAAGPGDKQYLEVAHLNACPAGFDGACVSGHLPGAPPRLKVYHYYNGDESRVAPFRRGCERAIGEMPPGVWSEG